MTGARQATWIAVALATILASTGRSGAQVTNVVTVAADNEPATIGGFSTRQNNDATVVTPLVTSADMSVTKSDAPDPVPVGGTLVYTITVTNGGPSNAPNASLSDPLPGGTTFLSLAAAAGWTCTPPAVGANGTLSCSASTFPVGSAVFTLTVAVPASTPLGMLVNTVTVASSASSDPVGGNEVASTSTTVEASADLSVTKTVSPNPVVAGANLVYTITATNSGPSDAANATLSDPLPGGTTFVSLAVPAGWSCLTPAVGSSGTVSCSAATFPVGSVVFTLTTALPLTTPGGPLANTVTVASATSDPASGNQAATATAAVQGAPVIVIPTLGAAGFGVLALVLCGWGVVLLRRVRRS